MADNIFKINNIVGKSIQNNLDTVVEMFQDNEISFLVTKNLLKFVYYSLYTYLYIML